MYHFFCWIPYSLKNSLTKFDNFFINRINWLGTSSASSMDCSSSLLFEQVQIQSTRACFGHISLIRTRNHSSFLFLDSLSFKEHFFKFSNFLSTFATGWELVQLDHCPSLYGAFICVILESKSYLVQAHKLNIRPRNGLVPVVGHFLGCFQPTLSPFGFLVVK